MTPTIAAWDVRYERRAVALLALGFGLVGLDRFIILPLFPTIMKDLGLNYQDLGLIASIFSIAWGLAALVMGGVSDRVGRRRVLIPSVVIFSLLAGLSGLASGLVGLLVIRSLMGLSEGAYTPASIAATLEASKPSRRGFNLGIQQNLMQVVGLGLGPILATWLLLVLPSWRWVFVIASLPGLLVAFLMYRTLRDTQGTLATAADEHGAGTGDGAGTGGAGATLLDAFRHRNIPLNMLGMCCMLTCLLVTTTLAPSYLIDVLKLSTAQMGGVLSGIGFGAFVGQMILPGLSDRIGRKAVVLGCYVGALISLAGFLALPAAVVPLFATLFLASVFVNSMICLNVGPLTSEACPAALTATATGLVVGVGEAIGGGFAPAFAGYVAQNFGLHRALEIGLVGLAVGFVLALFLRETAPAVLARRAAVAG